MNMILPASVSATPNGTTSMPNGTTRPQVRIVIVGHVDHGKSTLVGRLLHETGSLPEGKLEMLKEVSARRGMPFEWSFLLDALQTERDQGITIDTTQIRFRTRSRDVVLIDAPGHAEFLRNMITGASQADGAVLIIDALEGVRDQTRRHGYLLHLLGIKQVAIVVNKMDRVDFSADRFKEISDEISAHLTGLGVTPIGDHSDFRARRRRCCRTDAARSAGTGDRPWSKRSTRSNRRGRWSNWRCGCRCRRSTSSTTAASWRAASNPVSSARRRRNRHHAGRQDREDQNRRELAGDAAHGQPRRRPLGRHHARPRTVHRARRRHRACRRNPARHAANSRPDFLAARQAAVEGRPDPDPARHAREPRQRGRDREGGRSRRTLATRETKAIARNHVGEIDISLAQPIAADPYSDNPRTGRLVIEVNGRIAGGGLVLSVDAGQRAVPIDIVPVEIRAAARGTLGALPPQRRGDLADRPAGLRQIDAGARAGAAAVRARRFADPARWRHPARRPQRRSRLFAAGSQRKHPAPRRGRDASGAQRPHRHRRRGLAVERGPRRGAPHRRHVIPRDLCRRRRRSLREPRPQGSLRQGARRHAYVVHRHRQRLSAADRMRVEHRHLGALGYATRPTRSSRCCAKSVFCSTNCRSGGQI